MKYFSLWAEGGRVVNYRTADGEGRMKGERFFPLNQRRLRSVKLNQLAIFCKIFELKSFSRAAKTLGLSQPTLSEHIQALEAQLGLAVFDRLGREVVPTKAGEVLYGYGDKILRLMVEAERSLSALKGDLSGELTLGASTIPGEYLLPPIIKTFRDSFPAISVHLRISDTDRVREQLLAGEIEVGFVGAKVEDSKVEYSPIAKDELVLVAPALCPWIRGASVAVKKLTEIPFVLREEGSGTRMVLEKIIRGQGIGIGDLRVVAKLGSTTAVIQAIKSGAGCSVLSRRSVTEEIARGTLRPIRIRKVKLEREFYAIHRRGRFKSALAKTFLHFLLEKTKTDTILR
jgi:DNA-binding transcriptional LysR family regulator